MLRQIEVTFVKDEKTEYYKRRLKEPRLFVTLLVNGKYADCCSFGKGFVKNDLYEPMLAVLEIEEGNLYSYLSIPEFREIYTKHFNIDESKVG